MRHLLFSLICLLVTIAPAPARAQTLPDCADRPTVSDKWVDFNRFCLEVIVDAPETGRLGYSALAFAPDGRLFATRPLTGELIALWDGDGDGLPESEQLVAEGLTQPNGLVFYGDTLYISGRAHIYRWRDGTLDVLVDDLPSGAGFWTGGLVIGPDERIYVGTGAPCDLCVPEDHERGAIVSFALDGSDRQLVATGLRHPADVVFAGETLWTVDSASSQWDDLTDLDELNVVTPGADFGWPACVGADNTLVLEGQTDCSEATAPAISLPTHSTPVGLAYYEGEALRGLEGRLLVVLQGSNNAAHMQGYALVAVHPNAPAEPFALVIPGNPADYWEQFTLQQLNIRTSGIWPRRPLDVAISPDGWLALSVGDGLIFALRPQ